MCSWLVMSRLVSLAGLPLSALGLAPVIIFHVTDRDPRNMMPFLLSLRVRPV